MFSGVTGNPLVLFAHGVFPFPHLFYSSLLDVLRCRCYDQHCVETRSAPPLHPHPPAAPQPLSLPACRPFWSPPPAEKDDCHNSTCSLLCNCLHCTHTSSLGLMLYSILSAFSLSWRLSIIARSSLEALFWAKDDKRQIGFFTWLSAFQTSRDSKSNASVLSHFTYAICDGAQGKPVLPCPDFEAFYFQLLSVKLQFHEFECCI